MVTLKSPATTTLDSAYIMKILLNIQSKFLHILTATSFLKKECTWLHNLPRHHHEDHLSKEDSHQ